MYVKVLFFLKQIFLNFINIYFFKYKNINIKIKHIIIQKNLIN